MARRLNYEFWTSLDQMDLTPEEKYFYLYLLTNPYTKLCGIYKISFHNMVEELGYNKNIILKMLHRFSDLNKICYNSRTKEIAILNWPKHHFKNDGKPVLDCIRTELSSVKDKKLIKLLAENVLNKKIKSIFDDIVGHKTHTKIDPSDELISLDKLSEYCNMEITTVHLSRKEFDRFIQRYGLEDTVRFILKLEHYKKQHGKKYDSDSSAIYNWVIKAILGDKKNIVKYSKVNVVEL